ncbi:unnamed protein product, partial [Hymenolepis diminuta]
QLKSDVKQVFCEKEGGVWVQKPNKKFILLLLFQPQIKDVGKKETVYIGARCHRLFENVRQMRRQKRTDYHRNANISRTVVDGYHKSNESGYEIT